MKHLLLTAVVILAFTSMTTAQLSVSPNVTTSTDSFIYVDGVVITVEGYVRLVENIYDTDTEASMYLRNQAQLMQNGNAQNRGTGAISVQQDSNSDAYDYNLWASPVSVPVAAFGNNLFGISRINETTGLTSAEPATLKTGHDGVSSPLQISRRWFYRWAPASQEFVAINNADVVPPGYGFIMKGTDITQEGVPETQNQTYDFRGRPNSGDIEIPLFPVGTNDEGNTLTGNPYPSALDLDAFFWDSANAGKFTMIQYYDEDRTINSHAYVDNKAGYGTWAPGGLGPNNVSPGDPSYDPGVYTIPVFQNFNNDGTPAGGNEGSGDYLERRMAPIGQGFFIKASPGVNSQTTLTFKNSHRRFVKESTTYSEFRNQEGNTTSNNGTLTGSVSGGNTIDPTIIEGTFTPRLRINTYMGTSHMRQTALLFNDNATDEFDLGGDAISPMDATSEMYFPVLTPWNDEKPFPFVINTVPFNISKKIPVTFEIEEEMRVSVTGIEELNLPTDHTYMYDSLNDTYQEITGNNTASYFLEQGKYENRFYIVFIDYDPTITANEIYKKEQTKEMEASVDFFQNNRQGQLEVSNPEGYDIKSAVIFDMAGRLVLNQQNLGNNRNLQFPTGTFSDGVYLVLLTTTTDLVIDYKILVENK
ncbi:MAG: T9SS type A sorting domain-containing protein [Patiriisocius sp.]|uniref:T9SS type A sorting domain-containing protein n=1 Tax=Patiriisocius sp. TaxID=2822396 RepID=UPI003EF21C78